MSGVYVYEISPRKEGEKNIIKIGSTRHCVEGRIEDSFKNKFNNKDYSYYPLEIIPCNISIAFDIENYLINKFIEIIGTKPSEGREWFECSKDKAKPFLDDIPNMILDFYNIFRSYSSYEKSIGNMVRFKRRAKKLTQTDLSEIANLRQGTISDIENGNIGHYSTLKKVMSSLDISIAFLDNQKQNSLVMLNN